MGLFHESEYNNFDESYFRRAKLDGPRGGYGKYDSVEGAGGVDYDTFIEEVDTLTGSDPTLLIVGCGTGVTVRGLRSESEDIDDAYGMDISEWAIENHAPGISQNLIQGDARNPDDFEDAKDEWNINQAFDVIYTEFVLSHYDDDSARTIHQNCIDYVSHGGQQRGTVIHRMFSGTGHDWETEWFNLKTIAEWQDTMSDIDPDGVTVYWIDYDRPEDSTI